jgi:hypothetical protein
MHQQEVVMEFIGVLYPHPSIGENNHHIDKKHLKVPHPTPSLLTLNDYGITIASLKSVQNTSNEVGVLHSQRSAATLKSSRQSRGWDLPATSNAKPQAKPRLAKTFGQGPPPTGTTFEKSHGPDLVI